MEGRRQNTASVQETETLCTWFQASRGTKENRGKLPEASYFQFIRLKTQGKHIDQHAAAMFVPCVTAQFIREWDGTQPYKVICIVGDVDDIKTHQAAVEIGMTRTSDSCNQNDIDAATDRLRECLKALALSLVQRSSFQEVTFHLRDLRQMQRFLKKKGKLKLPLWTPTEATVYIV